MQIPNCNRSTIINLSILCSVIALVTVMVTPVRGFAQEECKGTKRWYKGKCRYPDEINKLKSKGKIDSADKIACEKARVQGTAESWKAYLALFPDGVCADEAVKASKTEQEESTNMLNTQKLDKIPVPTTFNPLSDFSITRGNPNGSWTYGWMSTDFLSFTPFSHNKYILDICPLWYGNTDPPSIWVNKTNSTQWGVSPGLFTMHPGPGQEPTALRWTAPSDGTYSVVGKFLPGDSSRMLVGVRQGNKWLWQGVDSGSFDLVVSLTAHESLDFVVYGGYAGGNTPLDLSISREEKKVDADTTVIQDGLVLWLEADKGLQVDHSGKVTAWMDQSENGYRFISNNPPTLEKQATGNRKNAVRFSSVMKTILMTESPVNLLKGTKRFIAFIVIRPGTVQDTYADILDYNHAHCKNFVIQQEGTSTNSFGPMAPQMLDTSKFQVFTHAYFYLGPSFGRFFSAVNGQNKTIGDGCGQTFVEPARLSIGGNLNLGRFMSGDISEILLYNRILSGEEMKMMENYLMAKYGISFNE